METKSIHLSDAPHHHHTICSRDNFVPCRISIEAITSTVTMRCDPETNDAAAAAVAAVVAVLDDGKEPLWRPPRAPDFWLPDPGGIIERDDNGEILRERLAKSI